ncbi:MAG: nucleotidyltransferase domain-containing protein [Nitrospirota bacterium]
MVELSRTVQLEVASRATEVAQEVARLARKILGHEAAVLWFGSWPGGRAQPHSDLDIAVSTGRLIPPDQLAVLREAVEELPTLYEVDLVDLSAVGARLKEEVLRHGVRL